MIMQVVSLNFQILHTFKRFFEYYCVHKYDVRSLHTTAFIN